MGRRHCIAVMVVCGMAWLLCARSPQQPSDQTYDLHGKVVNANTGTGIANALVQLGGRSGQSTSPKEGWTQFSGADGAFAFTNIAGGNYSIRVRKPGFFNMQEAGLESSGESVYVVPADADPVLTLVPEGVIFGTVENESGQPIENLSVRVETWQVANGVRRLVPAGTAETDDEGQYRLAELKPGTYYLHFTSNANAARISTELVKKKQEAQGYGSQFYPGVPDSGSAAPIRVRAGSQVQITQKLKNQKLYDITGVVHGANPETGFHTMLMDDSGNIASPDLHLDTKTGQFQVLGVPEGAYLLHVVSTDTSSEKNGVRRPQLMARVPIHLSSDVNGLVVALSQGASVDVNVEDLSNRNEGFRQIFITLTLRDFPQFSDARAFPQGPGSNPNFARGFQNLAPGAYEVQAAPSGSGYVSALRCGDVDLMRDDLIVGSGGSIPPIEVTLRDDGAALSIQAVENGQSTAATVLLYSQEYPQSSLVQRAPGRGNVLVENIRPGDYTLLAMKGIQEVEFRDPEFLQKYLPTGKDVSLKAGDKVTLQVEVQQRDSE
jgi:hypothetical protein